MFLRRLVRSSPPVASATGEARAARGTSGNAAWHRPAIAGAVGIAVLLLVFLMVEVVELSNRIAMLESGQPPVCSGSHASACDALRAHADPARAAHWWAHARLGARQLGRAAYA